MASPFGVWAAARGATRNVSAPRVKPSVGDPLFRELAIVALDAARGAGARETPWKTR